MIIDAHHHLPADWEPYVDKLRAECARLGIDRVRRRRGLYGGEHAGNEQTAAALRAHSRFLLGYGWVRLGEDPPARVDELQAMGFHGVKFIWPLKNYDDDAFLPVYERAEAAGHARALSPRHRRAQGGVRPAAWTSPWRGCRWSSSTASRGTSRG